MSVGRCRRLMRFARASHCDRRGQRYSLRNRIEAIATAALSIGAVVIITVLMIGWLIFLRPPRLRLSVTATSKPQSRTLGARRGTCSAPTGRSQ